VGWVRSWGEGLLSLIPCLIKHRSAGGSVGVGVAGWNASAACPNVLVVMAGCSGCDDWVELGTLLGPEETPVGVVLGAIPGSGCLTRGFSVWWWWWVRGVVVC
jgi:hypothetical protein